MMPQQQQQPQPQQQQQQRAPWYRSGSGSFGNRAIQGTAGAVGGALIGSMLAHETGRRMGRGAMIGAAAGAVGGFLGGHHVNRWVNQNPSQYNTMMSVTNKIAASAEKTVLAHYGLAKLSSGPESNVHKDAGTYRFNRAAESADIDDAKQYVFKAHDRKPQVTGDESGQGITFREGVSG